MRAGRFATIACCSAIALMVAGCGQPTPKDESKSPARAGDAAKANTPAQKPPAAGASPAEGAKTWSAKEPRTEPAKEREKGPAAENKTEPAKDTEQTPAREPENGPGKDAVQEPASALPKVPLGLPALKIPDDNPMTAEKIELGKLLYFDPRLSKDGKISCATCHNPKEAWAEHEPVSTGIGGQKGGRNSPTVINAAYAPAQFWDGRAATLEEQALGPIENPIEMGHHLDAMIADLSKLDDYKARFQKVFGAGITKDGVAKAIAAFERTVLSGDSPYDRFKAGDEKALSDAQKRGLELFETAGCSTCHAPPLFSNYRYYNAGVDAGKEKPDAGRMDVTKKEEDRGKFRTPALRDVADTAPYFHDGSAAKLEDAVALMAAGGKENPGISPMLKAMSAAKLTDENKTDILEFLKALSGEYPVVEPPKLP